MSDKEKILKTLSSLLETGILTVNDVKKELITNFKFKKDKLIDDVLGAVMKKSLLAYKNDEWERYHQAVTDWEVKEYLRLY